MVRPVEVKPRIPWRGGGGGVVPPADVPLAVWWRGGGGGGGGGAAGSQCSQRRGWESSPVPEPTIMAARAGKLARSDPTSPRASGR